jgi:hypothetical protein
MRSFMPREAARWCSAGSKAQQRATRASGNCLRDVLFRVRMSLAVQHPRVLSFCACYLCMCAHVALTPSAWLLVRDCRALVRACATSTNPAASSMQHCCAAATQRTAAPPCYRRRPARLQPCASPFPLTTVATNRHPKGEKMDRLPRTNARQLTHAQARPPAAQITRDLTRSRARSPRHPSEFRVRRRHVLHQGAVHHAHHRQHRPLGVQVRDARAAPRVVVLPS